MDTIGKIISSERKAHPTAAPDRLAQRVVMLLASRGR